MVVVCKEDMRLIRSMVVFDRRFLERFCVIEVLVSYTVADLAGNVSMASEPVEVNLQLMRTEPHPLPTVKEAGHTTTLDPDK
ncbi:hypothetical protein RA278_29100, partial [Pseudomonas syringae pv. tagetis]